MRSAATLPALAALALLAAAPPARGADDPVRIELEVGEASRPLGSLPRCDDLSIAAPTADSRGLKGLKVGATLCSFDTSGGAGRRLVYRVVVVPPRSGPAPASGGPERGAGQLPR